MINNSSLQKWDRLSKKQLNQQFMQEMIEGMRCSPFEAKAILEMTHKVFGSYFETNGSLKPGQIYFMVTPEKTPPGCKLIESKPITVVLTLDAGEEDLDIREKEGVVGLRRYRLQRICEEAFQQGGLLTIEDIANRLFNCGERTLARDLQYFRESNITLPLRSTVKDMGRSISHRSIIVKEWLKGKEYSEISRDTYHSVPSIKNYITKFKRVVALSDEGFDIHTISFLVRLSAPLTTEYYNLYKQSEIIDHRLSELKSFLKEQKIDSREGGAND